MPMLADPTTKYAPYNPVLFPVGYERRWPKNRTTAAPIWLSTDLRDGNQALINPMSHKTKLEFFRLLVRIGFKEIEVSYPSASETEFAFVRSLIENKEVPDDVTLQVITPARSDLIERSIASLAGAKSATIHLYNAVSPLFREVVFRNSEEQTIDLTLNAVRLVKKLTEEETIRSGTKFCLNYCLETFSQTEPEFAVQLGNRVLEAWGKAGPGDNKVIFNLAATVECAPSNHYADMVEYFSTHINHREHVILSIHPHNDRGTAVAAAELAMLAGGDRVEGCLLGNGERTGNVDLISLALNLYSQGVSPNLDFSNLSKIVEVVCRANEMSTPQRYPYAGALVFTAFAGTHQDAIKKGLDAQRRRWELVDCTSEGNKFWAVPYIPLDPKDLGYGYENLIRVSSQSGKAGAAYIIKETLGLEIPRRMQVAFYRIVQSESERSEREMTAALVVDAFKRSFGFDVTSRARLLLRSFQLRPLSPSTSSTSDGFEDTLASPPDEDGLVHLEAHIDVDGKARLIQGQGRSLIEALIDALRLYLGVTLSVHEASVQSTESKDIAAFLEVSEVTSEANVWGVGVSKDISESRCRALLSAANIIVSDDRVFHQPKLVFTSRTAPGYTLSRDGYFPDMYAGRSTPLEQVGEVGVKVEVLSVAAL